MTLLYLISAFRPAFTPTIAKASKSSQYLLKAAAARYFIHAARTALQRKKSKVCRIPEERSRGRERRLHIKLASFLDGNQL